VTHSFRQIRVFDRSAFLGYISIPAGCRDADNDDSIEESRCERGHGIALEPHREDLGATNRMARALLGSLIEQSGLSCNPCGIWSIAAMGIRSVG
jgi:hypothetical protein